MYQFRATGALLSFLAIAAVCVVGLLGDFVLKFTVELLQTAGFYQFTAVAATCILGGVVTGIKRRLPNYGSRPPLTSLVQHLKAPGVTGVIALALIACLVALMMAAPELTRFRVLALNASIGLNLGVFGWCSWLCLSLTSQYRAKCMWEDLVHPNK